MQVTPADISDLITLCRDSVGSAAAAALSAGPAPALAGRASAAAAAQQQQQQLELEQHQATLVGLIERVAAAQQRHAAEGEGGGAVGGVGAAFAAVEI